MRPLIPSSVPPPVLISSNGIPSLSPLGSSSNNGIPYAPVLIRPAPGPNIPVSCGPFSNLVTGSTPNYFPGGRGLTASNMIQMGGAVYYPSQNTYLNPAAGYTMSHSQQIPSTGAPSELPPLHAGSGLFPYMAGPGALGIGADMRGNSAPFSPLPAAQRGPTVYLGHLTADTDDMVVRQLLQECGKVMRWSRTTDPATKKLSSFGFCEFESPLGVTRAVRCLNGLLLDGKPLVANCEDKVKEGLEQWRNDRKNKLQEENPAKSIQEIEHEIEKEEVRITQTTQRIAAEWNAKLAYSKAAAALAEKAAALQAEAFPQPPPPPTAPPTLTTDIQKNTKAQTGAEKERSNTEPVVVNIVPQKTVTRKQKVLDALHGYVEISPATSTMSAREASRIRQWNMTLKDGRADLRKRVLAWERKEEFLQRDRKRRREDFAIAVKNPSRVSSSQRRRLLERDLNDLLYYLAPDGTVWEGDLSARRTEERKNWLAKERDWDFNDSILEVEEKKEITRKAEEALQLEKEKLKKQAEEEEAERVKQLEDEEKEKQRLAAEKEALEAEEASRKEEEINRMKNSSVLDNDISELLPAAPINFNISLGFFNQSTASLRNQTDTLTPTASYQTSSGISQIPSHNNLGDHSGSINESKIGIQTGNSKVSSVFLTGDDDDDDEFNGRRHKTLVRLDTHLDKGNQEAQGGNMLKRKQDLMMKLVAQIPKTTEDMFSFPIDWILLKNNNIFELKVTPWINKKVIEFLGEEEPELAAFISTKVSLGPDPELFLNELKEFLDDDAKGFVAKLWRMLIFEVLRLRQMTSHAN